MAIHASSRFPRDEKLLCTQEPFRSALKSAGYHSTAEIETGAVLAVARLVDCIPTDVLTSGGRGCAMLTEREEAFGNYGPDRYAWVFEDVQLLTPPVPARGMLGLWDWTWPIAAAPASTDSDSDSDSDTPTSDDPLPEVPRRTAVCTEPGCGAAIYWLKHEKSGKPAPIDAAQSETGNILINLQAGTYRILPVAEREVYAGWLHVNHFGTCTKPQQFKPGAYRKKGQGPS